jgi:hypothetical protein
VQYEFEHIVRGLNIFGREILNEAGGHPLKVDVHIAGAASRMRCMHASASVATKR